MVSFSNFDIFIITGFFVIVLLIGILSGKKGDNDTEEFMLSGRKVGLLLFILTNVSTWYGGILGVGEFTYSYGVASWFTQGLPYYVFAILFAILFAEKVRGASLYTIPDKLEVVFGRKVGNISAILIFILVSPAPYLLMVGSLFTIIFGINIYYGLTLAIIISIIYLFVGGYKSDLYTDVFQFFVMFIGFGIIVYFSFTEIGDFRFLKETLPPEHLNPSGGLPYTYIIVWFLIALWTFTDPGFHQRCYSAKSGKVAKWGIIISVLFWGAFDFLTTSTGLFSKAVLPNLEEPVLAFPLYAEKVLSSGYKGLFYAAMFATIMSTLNSFLFLSATTLSKDFLMKTSLNERFSLKQLTRAGLILSSVIAVVLAILIPSVINIWYTVGSICIPGLILPIISSYYKSLKISAKGTLIEIISGAIGAFIWFLIKDKSDNLGTFSFIEPMIIGLFVAIIIHFIFYFREGSDEFQK